MSAEEHRAEANDDAVWAAVLTVSSTRTEAEDLSGPAIIEALLAAGHRVAHREIVDDDVHDIQVAVQRQVDAGVPLVVLTGGTGLTPRDVTPEAIEPMLTRPIPGFGELFRWLSYEEVGAAAMLSRAVGGLMGRTAVFALPGSRKACQLAMRKLIVPELRHVVSHARTQEATVGRGKGWQAALTSVGTTLQRDAREPLPDRIAGIPAIRDRLAAAGEQAVVELGQWRYSLFGFPDLRRPDSRVLAISAGGSLAEIVALHRHPAEVGTCVRGDGGWVVSRDRPVAAVSNAITGRPPPEGGALFAVSEDTVWVERGGQVFAWNGRTQEAWGPPPAALARLIQAWATS